MQAVINAFVLTIELWIFLGILLTALVFEAIIKAYKHTHRSEL